MSEKINLFSKRSTTPLSINEPKETKKCQKCLRRIDLKYVICPYCRSGDFQLDNN